MKRQLLSFALFLITLISCDSSRDCPAASTEATSWLIYPQGDTIRFINGTGDTIRFVVQPLQLSPAYTEKCSSRPIGLIKKCDACVEEARLEASSTTSRNGKNTLSVSFSATATDTHPGVHYTASTISYSIFDLNRTMPLPATGTVHLTLGGVSYTGVSVFQADTLLVPSLMVWESYYNDEYGIIGFADRQTHSTFYRE